MLLKIREFSRELVDISQKDGRWVSGGYGSEIGTHHSVPEKIKDSVNRGDFSLNDNYPPKQEEYAIIAREIDEYCVLAIATRELDDKSRYFVAYRYFWLEKPQENQDIDGLGILLFWWLQSGQPKYEFQKNQIKLDYNVPTSTVNFLYQELHQHFGENVAGLLEQIKSYPVLLENESNEVLSLKQIQYLAITLHQKYSLPLVWAWNVYTVEYPQSFTIISLANNHAYPAIVKDLKKCQKPLGNSQVQEESSSDKSNNEFQNQKVSPENSLILKNLLLTISRVKAEFKRKELIKLIEFLGAFSINDIDKENVIEKTVAFYADSEVSVIYHSLLALLGFEPVDTWLNLLKEVSNSKFINEVFHIHQYLLYLSRNKYNSQAERQLINCIYKGISQLLVKCKEIDNHSDKYHDIQWLLFKSKSVWCKYFQAYTQKLTAQLASGKSNFEGDYLYPQLLSSIKQWEKDKEKKLMYMNPKYQTLALLTDKIKNHSLAALFYQLSDGSVPKNIYQNVHIKIIPLTLRESRNKLRLSKDKIEFLLILFSLSLLTMSAVLVIRELGKDLLPMEKPGFLKKPGF